MAEKEEDEPVSVPQVKVDETTPASVAATTTQLEPQSSFSELSPTASGSSLSPQSSPELSKKTPVGNYYSARPKFDRLGNPIPEHRRTPGAMSSVFGSSNATHLPGDLGPNDPRRPRSPAPHTLPGDLGPNDPRRPRSTNSSPAPSPRFRAGSDLNEPREGERIAKDPHLPEDEERNSSSSSEDETPSNEVDPDTRGRGRIRPEPGRTTSGKSVNVRSDSEDSVREDQASDYDSTFKDGVKPDPTKGESYNSVVGSQRRQRLRTTPSGKRRVHPSTAFDAPPKLATAYRDEENHIELRAAQKLSLTMSQIHSTPSAHRVIRQIIRGDYQHFQQEAEEGRKRQRMYLVATDLSSEAEYALEWTIGTVLRDGDTLFAVYAVDEEVSGLGGEGGVEIGHGADSVRDTASIVRSLTSEPGVQPPGSPGPTTLGKAGAAGASNSKTDLRSRSHGVFSNAENDRRRFLEAVTERCVRLLRKTRLQVRVVVEVFHCKSPRHMITEVIDFLSPTLVVIGSRGRSAVKGVLLGSFSNYLVTKSSVPVMVARKKLRKHGKGEKTINRDGTTVPYSGSGRTGVGRLSNVIEAPKGRGLRVQGWDKVGID